MWECKHAIHLRNFPLWSSSSSPFNSCPLFLSFPRHRWNVINRGGHTIKFEFIDVQRTHARTTVAMAGPCNLRPPGIKRGDGRAKGAIALLLLLLKSMIYAHKNAPSSSAHEICVCLIFTARPVEGSRQADRRTDWWLRVRACLQKKEGTR